MDRSTSQRFFGVTLVTMAAWQETVGDSRGRKFGWWSNVSYFLLRFYGTMNIVDGGFIWFGAECGYVCCSLYAASDEFVSESIDDGNLMTRTVSITLSVATGYMLLVIGLMVWCRYRQLQRKQAHLAESEFPLLVVHYTCAQYLWMK